MTDRKTVLGRSLAAAPAACLAVASLALVLTAKHENEPRPSRFAVLVAEAKRRVRAISVTEFDGRLRRAGRTPQIIDVRENGEWEAGRLPGAVHLSRGVLEREIEKIAPDADAEIILYCGADARSALAAESLQRMGYRRVVYLRGGFRAWLDAGHAPVYDSSIRPAR